MCENVGYICCTWEGGCVCFVLNNVIDLEFTSNRGNETQKCNTRCDKPYRINAKDSLS